VSVPGLISVGYQGRTVAELVDLLVSVGADVLVDVRLTPLSRKPGLSKRGLSEHLADAGIGYLHLRELGNPRDNRDGFRRGEPANRERYLAVLSSDEGRAGLDRVRELIRTGPVALLCFEQEHDTCHRGLIVDWLVRTDPGIEVRRL
jgi:uncharacterized protein (DUF488 family)